MNYKHRTTLELFIWTTLLQLLKGVTSNQVPVIFGEVIPVATWIDITNFHTSHEQVDRATNDHERKELKIDIGNTLELPTNFSSSTSNIHAFFKTAKASIRRHKVVNLTIHLYENDQESPITHYCHSGTSVTSDETASAMSNEEGTSHDICSFRYNKSSISRVAIYNGGDYSVCLSAVGFSTNPRSHALELSLTEDGKQRLQETTPTRDISFVSVMGPRGTGKSTIASLLTGYPTLFKTGTRSTGTTTRGVHMSPKLVGETYSNIMPMLLDTEVINNASIVQSDLYIYDTEGMGMYGKEQDLLMLVPFGLLSKTIVWVISGALRQSDLLGDLKVFVEAAEKVQTSRHEKVVFGDLVVVLNKMQGSESDEELSQNLLEFEALPSNDFVKRNRIRRKLYNCFRSIRVIGLPFLNLNPFPEHLNYSHLHGPNQRFSTGLGNIVSVFTANTASNMPFDISGATVLPLVDAVVDASNAGQVDLQNVTFVVDVQKRVGSMMLEINTEISLALENNTHFTQICSAAIVKFFSDLDSLANGFHTSRSTLINSIRKKTADRLTTMLTLYINTYLSDMMKRVKVIDTETCKLLPIQAMKCSYENTFTSFSRIFRELRQIGSNVSPELTRHLHSKERTVLSHIPPLKECAKIRLQFKENTKSCSIDVFESLMHSLNESLLLNDEYYYSIRDSIKFDIERCHNESEAKHFLQRHVSEICRIDSHIASLEIKRISDNIAMLRNIKKYKGAYKILAQDLNGIHHSTLHIEVSFSNTVLLLKHDCDLSLLLRKDEWAQKDVQLICWVAKFTNDYDVKLSYKSLSVIAHRLILDQNLSLTFNISPFPTRQTDHNRVFINDTRDLRFDGVNGRNGANGRDLYLKATHIEGPGILSVNASGGDGERGENGRPGANGADGDAGRNATAPSDPTYLDFKTDCRNDLRDDINDLPTCECVNVLCQNDIGRQGQQVILALISTGRSLAVERLIGCCHIKFEYEHRAVFAGEKGYDGSPGKPGADGGNGGAGGNAGKVVFDIPSLYTDQFIDISQPGKGRPGGVGGLGGLHGMKGKDGNSLRCTYDITIQYDDIVEYFTQDHILAGDIPTCEWATEAVSAHHSTNLTTQIAILREAAFSGSNGKGGINGYSSNASDCSTCIDLNDVSRQFFSLVSTFHSHEMFASSNQVFAQSKPKTGGIYVPRKTTIIERNCLENIQIIENSLKAASNLENYFVSHNLNTSKTTTQMLFSHELEVFELERSNVLNEMYMTESLMHELQIEVNELMHSLQIFLTEMSQSISDQIRAELDTSRLKSVTQQETTKTDSIHKRNRAVATVAKETISFTINVIKLVSGDDKALGDILGNCVEIGYQYVKVGELSDVKQDFEFQRDRIGAEKNADDQILEKQKGFNDLSQILEHSAWLNMATMSAHSNTEDSLLHTVFSAAHAFATHGRYLYQANTTLLHIEQARIHLKRSMLDMRKRLFSLEGSEQWNNLNLELEQLFDLTHNVFDNRYRFVELQHQLQSTDTIIEQLVSQIHALNSASETDVKHKIEIWIQTGILYHKAKQSIVTKLLSFNASLSYLMNDVSHVPVDINPFKSVESLQADLDILKGKLNAVSSTVVHLVKRNIVLDPLEFPHVFEAFATGMNHSFFEISHFFDTDRRYWVNTVKVELINVDTVNSCIFTRLIHPGFDIHTLAVDPLMDVSMPRSVYESLYTYSEASDMASVEWLIVPHSQATQQEWLKPSVHTLWQLEIPSSYAVAGVRANTGLQWTPSSQIRLEFDLSYYM